MTMRDELDIHDSIAVRDYMQEALNAAYVDLNVRIGKTYLDGECIELICVRSKTDKKDLPVVFDRYELGKKLKEQFPVEVYWEEKEKTDYANAMLDSEWVLDNVYLEVASEQYHDKFEILPGTVKEKVEGTDLYLIPHFKLPSRTEGKYDICRVQERYFEMFNGVISREELFAAAERNLEVEVERRPNGFIHVLPSAKIFCKGYLDELLGEEVQYGVYVLPYLKEESMLFVNKTADTSEISDNNTEMKEIYSGSRAQLISLKVVTMENRLSSKLYFYKDGKFQLV